MDRPVPQVQLKEQRERAIERLCEAFAQDRLELAELETRIDLAHRAATPADLDALLVDLPAPAPEPAPAPGTGARVREVIRENRTLIAFMGGVERRGNWSPGRKNVVIAFMGGADLDFRDVDLPPGETEVFVFAMMGGVDIVVPPELVVDASGIAIMGGFGHSSAPRNPAPGSAVLRINGFCMMGGVDISVRRRGETPKDARLREREERIRAREEQKRLRGRE
ncbi:MAG TPA: DUF1707 domain-containing protein [Longimicrobiales bacterium]|nr:DUF1707 domain-containing protein [Longimicrobiales bacterium]